MFKLLGFLVFLLVLVGLVSWRRRQAYRFRHYAYPDLIEMTPEAEEQLKRECEVFSDFRCCEVHRTFPRPREIPHVRVGDVRRRMSEHPDCRRSRRRGVEPSPATAEVHLQRSRAFNHVPTRRVGVALPVSTSWFEQAPSGS